MLNTCMNKEKINGKCHIQGYSSDEQSSTDNEVSDIESDNAEPTVWDKILPEEWVPGIEQFLWPKRLNLLEKACHQANPVRLLIEKYYQVWDEISQGFICQR